MTNQYGHFGRRKGDKNFKNFTWEQTDKASALVKAIAK
jgi:S-adenosylmethionine synthetase